MRRIGVVGTGYVGLVTGTCLAELGNRVVCADTDESKIALLRRGEVPIFEPGLREMIARNRAAGRLTFTTRIDRAAAEKEIVFIAVGTPVGARGKTELRPIRQAARDIGCALIGPAIVVVKSTVPVGTAELVATIVREHARVGHDVAVVANPEFLREGSAIADFMHPDRIVIGVADPVSEAVMRDLYAPLGAPVIVTAPRAAELIKYAANAFLATKISFVNELAAISERLAIDVAVVAAAVGMDPRIGPSYLEAGLGFGGSCLPKDLRGLLGVAGRHGARPRLLRAALEVNRGQIERVVATLGRLLGGLRGRRIGVLGLAFKPGTADVRESPALALVRRLVVCGADVVAHDPAAIRAARGQLADSVSFVPLCYEAAAGADALVIATGWREYRRLKFSLLRKLMRGRIFFDARNLYDAAKVAARGFVYAGIGRPVQAASSSVAEHRSARGATVRAS